MPRDAGLPPARLRPLAPVPLWFMLVLLALLLSIGAWGCSLFPGQSAPPKPAPAPQAAPAPAPSR